MDHQQEPLQMPDPSPADFHNGSLWFDSLDEPPAPRLPDALPQRTDVAIVGGGYTGLWSAYYLKRAAPDLDITLFEADTVGFGASGRNGGWCMGAAWGVERLLADPQTASAGIALQRALFDTVEEIGRICQAENIDAHFARGGTLTVATLPFQVDTLQRHLAHLHDLGFSTDDYRWLPPDEARGRIRVQPNHGALYSPHCAAVHPARLVRGLAQVVQRLGVTILERTPVSALEPGRVHTPRGAVHAGRIIRATEGYTGSIAGHRRDLIPVYSMMVATEPLSEALWQEIGLHDRETFGDPRRMVIYGQRTLDNRLAFGGRAGYYFGSRRRRIIPPDDPKLGRVEQTLRSLLPQLDGIAITHRWGGLLGVPRHWRPCVTFDARSGMGWAGGYIGEGVAASNLAGRIMTELVLERASPLTRLPWVDDQARRWEPEPLRWLGARAVEQIGVRADRAERRSGHPSRLWGGLFERFFG
ncbi:MAG: FAD-binding oxidoreductase [Pseudomonadales bacterium]